MLGDLDFKNLAFFGINEPFISYFNNLISSYITNSIPLTITEPTIIFSDLHANLTSLKLTFKFAEEHGINSYISLGDLIEYNTKNNEVLGLIKSQTRKFLFNIKGNHDEGTMKDDYFVSSQFHDHIRKDLGEFIISLPQNGFIEVNNKKILLCHANPWNLDILYLFPENKNFIEYFLDKLPCDGFMFGHTHFLTWFTSKKNSKFAFNPGSLGVSRDGTKSLHFALLEPETGKITSYSFHHAERDYLKIENESPVKVDEYNIEHFQ